MSEDPSQKLASDFVKAMGAELVRQSYADVKAWLVSLGLVLGRTYRRGVQKRFDSVPELLEALRTRTVEDGDLITIDCKPSRFGPFLRHHFLPAIIGNHTDMRLGPRIESNNIALAVFGQTMSHLTPVGLYPHLPGEVVQAMLYPSDSPACGFVSMVPWPDVGKLVPSFPAVFAARHTPYFSESCHVTGVLRLIDRASLTSAGLNEEDQETLRQQESLWFLDASTDESACIPSGVQEQPQLWGGLYASGHLEIAAGNLPLDDVINAIGTAIEGAAYTPQVTQNLAGQEEVLVFAQGCRAVISSKAPLFSIHMDVELARGFGNARAKFDGITARALSSISDACSRRGVALANSLDLDFTYTDSAQAFSVLESNAAQNMRDPIAIAIRDWHRRRNAPATGQ